MPHIVVADPIHPEGIERLLKAPGVTLDHPGKPSNELLAERLRQADGLIVRGTVVDEALLKHAERLKVVCRHGVGYDLVDVPALTKRGIALMITPEANAASVAEHALMLMLSLARNVVGGVGRGAAGQLEGARPVQHDRAGRTQHPDRRLRPHRHAGRAALHRLRHEGDGARSLHPRRHDPRRGLRGDQGARCRPRPRRHRDRPHPGERQDARPGGRDVPGAR